MKQKIKIIIDPIFLLFLSINSVKAQLSQTRSDIIKEKVYNFKSGITKDGVKYITYDKRLNTNASGGYIQTKGFYFTKLDDETEICYMTRIVEPSSETNSNVFYFKSKLVEVDYMQWKDYENRIIYDVVVKDGLCIISAWGDNKK